MKILFRFLSGILCSIAVFLVLALGGMPDTRFTRAMPGVAFLIGALSGFYLGYSGLSRLSERVGNRPLGKKLAFLVVHLLAIGVIANGVYRNMQSYSKYSYYVYSSDESVFASRIDPEDPRIIEHDRVTGSRVTSMDDEIDRGDGPKKGKVRWHVCFGIDCDEGWESRHYGE